MPHNEKLFGPSFSTLYPPDIIRDDDRYTIHVHGDLSLSARKRLQKNTVKLAHTSTGLHKFEELFSVSRNHKTEPIRVNKTTLILPQAEEIKTNVVDIAVEKLDEAYNSETLLPHLSEQIGTKTREDIALDIFGVKSLSYVLGVADDRGAIYDYRLRDHEVFDDFRRLPLIKECFEDGADFPGHRLGELTTAMGGVLKFLEAIETAHRDLPLKNPEKYKDLRREHDSSFAMAFRFLDMDDSNQAENTVVVRVVEKNLRSEMPSADRLEELRMIGELRNLELAHFEKPFGQKKYTYQLRGNSAEPYFDQDSGMAKLWKTFAEKYKIPKADSPRSLKVTQIQGPVILSNRKVSGERISSLENSNRNNFRGVAVHSGDGRICSLVHAERDLLSTDALVLQTPKIFKSNKPYVHLKNAVKKTEMLFRFLHGLTEKTLDHPSVGGEPILFPKEGRLSIEPMMEQLKASKALGYKPSDLFNYYSSFKPKHLSPRLVWDPRFYVEDNKEILGLPKYELMSQDIFQNKTGISSKRYTLGLIGGASVTAPKSVESMNMVSGNAARHCFNILTGGGTNMATVMGAMLKGPFNAFAQGYRNFNLVASRVPAAAIREGDLKHLRREFSWFDMDPVNDNDAYTRFKDFLHMFMQETLAERQHLIIAPANSLYMDRGGVGTVFEMLEAGLENLYVKLDVAEGRETLRGMHPGFDPRIRPIFVNNAAGYYDFLKDMFTQEQLELLRINLFDSAEQAWNAVLRHAESNNYSIQESEPTAEPIVA